MRTIVRNRILEKYRFKCCQCGSKSNLEIDHIIPLSKGGRHDEDNFQVLCRKCNRTKSNKLDYEYIKKTYFNIEEDPEYVLLRDDFPVMAYTPIEAKTIFNKIFDDHLALWTA